MIFMSKNNEQISLEIPILDNCKLISSSSKITMPATDKSDVNYTFLDKDKNTALLVIKNMETYREGIENLKSDGYKETENYAKAAYKKFHESEPPKEWRKIIAGIPSATEIFIKLIKDIKKAGTKNLIIDLRDNGGGNSLMCEMLIYFLYGKDALLKLNNGYSIVKYSPLFFQNYSSIDIDKINMNGDIRLNQYDYNFFDERKHDPDVRSSEDEYVAYFKSTPTFFKVFNSKKYHKQMINLKKVLVISNPLTYSSGFNLLTALYSNGAKIVGTPSGQSANNFGDALIFSLKNTGIRGFVSHKRILTYPEDMEKGHCFIPDYVLTLDKYYEHNCDPNTEIIYSIEILNSK